MQWTPRETSHESITYLHEQSIAVSMGELELTELGLLGMVNIVPTNVGGIEFEARDGETAIRIIGDGYAVEVALPIPFIKVIALMDGAITHASR